MSTITKKNKININRKYKERKKKVTSITNKKHCQCQSLKQIIFI